MCISDLENHESHNDISWQNNVSLTLIIAIIRPRSLLGQRCIYAYSGQGQIKTIKNYVREEK